MCYYKAVTVQPQRHEGSKIIMGFRHLSKEEESIATQIVDAAYTVHKKLGPGLLEKVYEVCFCHELTKRGLTYQRQIDLPIIYDGIVFLDSLSISTWCLSRMVSKESFYNLSGLVSLWLNSY
jgi:hypothetical protein